MRALHAEYGHVGGAIDLFNLLIRPDSRREPSGPAVEFLRTHPLTENRISAIQQWAKQNGAPTDGPRRALPHAIAALRQ